jgi:hypothetical protein
MYVLNNLPNLNCAYRLYNLYLFLNIQNYRHIQRCTGR